jgi:hypothetical protein
MGVKCLQTDHSLLYVHVFASIYSYLSIACTQVILKELQRHGTTWARVRNPDNHDGKF